MRTDVVIPALDEAASIAAVVRGVPCPPVRTVIVVDNGSTDGTGDRARAAGARVVVEARRGYGSACLAGLRALACDVEIVVFLDGDGSDDPSVLPALIRPIEEGRADLVVGSRSTGVVEPGALTPQQRLGNAVAARWLQARFGLEATDLGPFRAIRRSTLDALDMSDSGYGWTIEMQLKVARRRLRYVEIPVPYRRRIGVSKISGTLRGSVSAAVKILWLLVRHDLACSLVALLRRWPPTPATSIGRRSGQPRDPAVDSGMDRQRESDPPSRCGAACVGGVRRRTPANA
jgi:glycosyltransferase involved in cell wall biosynthesis